MASNMNRTHCRFSHVEALNTFKTDRFCFVYNIDLTCRCGAVLDPRAVHIVFFLNFLSQFVACCGFIYCSTAGHVAYASSPGPTCSIHPTRLGVYPRGEAGILDYAINYICYTLILYVSYYVMTRLILYALYYVITYSINSIILIMHVVT